MVSREIVEDVADGSATGSRYLPSTLGSHKYKVQANDVVPTVIITGFGLSWPARSLAHACFNGQVYCLSFSAR